MGARTNHQALPNLVAIWQSQGTELSELCPWSPRSVQVAFMSTGSGLHSCSWSSQTDVGGTPHGYLLTLTALPQRPKLIFPTFALWANYS